MLHLDVGALGADVVAAHGYKFLLSGFGNSAVYFSDRAFRELHVRMVGSRNSGGDTPELLDSGLTLPTDGKRFEISVPNLPSVLAMGESLDLLLEVGTEVIEHHVLALSARLIAGARERGYGIASSELTGERSAVVSVIPTGMPPADVHAQLRERGVVCAVRGGRLRFACHVFNTEAEIDQAGRGYAGAEASSPAPEFAGWAPGSQRTVRPSPIERGSRCGQRPASTVVRKSCTS